MKESYLNMIALVERLHRQFLELVRTELDSLGIQDINNVQALILFNIGPVELTVGELTLRGCYLGSNVSYNVKKMVENGYLSQERSVHDRRSIHVRLTDKGAKLRDRLLQKYGIEIGGGLGKLAGKILRVGTMGPLSTEEQAEFLLDAIAASI